MGKLDALEQAIGTNVTDSLTPRTDTTTPAPGLPAKLQGLVKAKNVAQISVTRIVADPDQPRETFEEEGLQLLAGSIKTNGILQPLVVRWSEEHSYYILIAGERRWRASQLAGLQSVPCTIIDKELDPSQILILQLIENLNRSDIKPLEAARGYRRLMELQNWSAGQLAEELHLPKSTVTRTLELLDLPIEVQTHVETGALAPSVAAEVGRLEDKSEQVELAARVVKEKLTRGDVVSAVRERKADKQIPSKRNTETRPKPGPEHRPSIDQPSHEYASTTSTRPVEIAVSGGYKVLIVGAPASAGPEALLDILRLAVDKVKAETAATI